MTVRFPSPVNILIGLGFPTRIRSANGALIILDDWCHERDATHQAATAACRDALLGMRSSKEARDAFVKFAKAADILIDRSSHMPAARHKRHRNAPA